jgi:asparagine synthase (glutamine-hydrolysing)
MGLGHRRLAILDLSSEGHQPMVSADGRFVLSFNGEIYNFRELRRDLEHARYPFRSTSDTEVLLAAMCEWGIDRTLEAANGMFAIAVWDERERMLMLARDRAGEKPLYYGWIGDEFVFASELKALRAHPRFEGHLNRDVIPFYLAHGYVSSPDSIFQGIFKVPPGCKLTIRATNGDRTAKPQAYWELDEVVEAALRDPLRVSEDEACAQLEELLCEAVSMRMEADVPLGAFLSGGVDSSLIVALMQAQSSRRVRTFTIGFHEAEYDEAQFARRVAGHLETDHTDLYVTPKETIEVIPQLPRLYDEPFADPSQVPTFLVSQLARRHVTVVLSGDAGDELFAGYTRYRLACNAWNAVRWIPSGARRFGATLGRLAADHPAWSGGDSPGLVNTAQRRASRMIQLLGATDRNAFYQTFLMSAPGSDCVTPDQLTAPPPSMGFLRAMQYSDLRSYLPDDILVKIDRAAMGVSLEGRVPFLDHRLIEFAWRLPSRFLIRRNTGKHIVRRVLRRYVPLDVFTRPKRGFSVPIASWLRGPLREWAEELLRPQRLIEEGVLNTGVVRQRWSEHLKGTYDRNTFLWNVLMFQAWFEAYRNTRSSAEVA